MIFDGEVVVREILLPDGIHGAIRIDPDGIANIYLNELDTEEVKQKTLRHEMRHLRFGHFDPETPIRMAETDAEK